MPPKLAAKARPSTNGAADVLGGLKHKKSRDNSKEIPIEEASQVEEVPKDDASDVPVATPQTSKKPKKRKRESNTEEQTGLVEEATPKKHKAILSKFERSSKRAEAAWEAAENEPQKEDDGEKPAEQLHGSLYYNMRLSAMLTGHRFDPSSTTRSCSRTRFRTQILHTTGLAREAGYRRVVQDRSI